MLLFVFFRFIVLMKVSHYILLLSKEIFKQKFIHYIFYQLYFFKHIFEQKFIALHLNENCLCSLLCFLSVLRYLNKACVFFCAKYLNKKKIMIRNCPDNLKSYTTYHVKVFNEIMILSDAF